MLCTSFSCVSWYFWYFGFLLCKHFYLQHSFRVTGIKLKSWVYFLPVTQPYVTQSHCSDAFLHHVLHLYFWQKLNWLSDFTNQTRLKAYPRFLRHQIMSTYLLLLLPQNVLKNKNKTNALTLKTALNHMNWSLGYLNSKMMCVNTDQHLRCREEASRGRCSWPVWRKADRARTPPRPERQKKHEKTPEAT